MPMTIHIPSNEIFNETTGGFILVPETNLILEHSLISLRKWEQIWNKPFLDTKGEKTQSELRSYIRCMTINTVDPGVYFALTADDENKIVEYIRAPMTATWFSDNKVGGQKTSRDIITAEIIYWWMIALNIPVEFQKWHLNSLLTLIKVVNEKQQPQKKMSQRDAAAQRKSLNAARRARYGSKG